jgi:hypothetical protein
VVVAALDYTQRTPFPGSAALLPVLGTAAVVAAGTIRPDSGVELVLRLRPLQELGRLSYSLYLWHWPILILAAGYIGHDLTLTQNLGLVALAVLLSYATFRLVEDPMRRSARLTSHTSNSLAFGAAAVAVSVFVANVLTSVQLTADDAAAKAASDQQTVAFAAAPPAAAPAATADPGSTAAPVPLSPVAQAVADSAKVRKLPTVNPPLATLRKAGSPANYDGCQVDYRDTVSPPCRYGDTSASRTVVLFGDSHASQWLPALAAAGKAHHFAVVVLTKSGCPFPAMTVYQLSLGRAFTECDTWRKAALRRLAALHPAMVVMSSTAYGVTLSSSPNDQAGVEKAWTTGFSTTVAAVRKDTGKLVLVGDAPVEGADPGQCLASHSSDITACSNATDNALTSDHDALQRKLAKAAHLPYVDVVDWFCTTAVCPMVVDGLVTHFDQWHVSAVYAASLTKPFASAIGVAGWK